MTLSHTRLSSHCTKLLDSAKDYRTTTSDNIPSCYQIHAESPANMQSMHRQFGKLMKRSADDSHVSVLLKDFDNADTLLAKVRKLCSLFYYNVICMETIPY